MGAATGRGSGRPGSKPRSALGREPEGAAHRSDTRISRGTPRLQIPPIAGLQVLVTLPTSLGSVQPHNPGI